MNRLYRDVAGPCLAPRGSVVCIGAFDGVHRGHRSVFDLVRQRAAALGAASIAVTFAPIPRAFFSRAVSQLSAPGEKAQAILDDGIERVLMLRFDAALAAMSAEEFIERVLVARLAAREVWVGEGFRFGHGRRGNLELLQRAGAEKGFDARQAPVYEMGGTRVSSSRVREMLAAGDFAAAAQLLGRRYTIGGHVVRGAQLGRKLGYPTANVRLGTRVAPVGGVFAVRVNGVHAEPMPGVASLGVRPTVNGKEPLLEAHLFAFDGDLYGRKIQVDFVQKLRDEEKFDSLDAMVRQIDRDARAARSILGCGTTAAAGATM